MTSPFGIPLQAFFGGGEAHGHVTHELIEDLDSKLCEQENRLIELLLIQNGLSTADLEDITSGWELRKLSEPSIEFDPKAEKLFITIKPANYRLVKVEVVDSTEEANS